MRCKVRSCTFSGQWHKSSPFLCPLLMSGGWTWQHIDAVELISVLNSVLNSNVFSCLQCISFTAGTYHYLVKLCLFYSCYLQKWCWVLASVEKNFTLCIFPGLSAVLSPFSSSTLVSSVCHHNPDTTKAVFLEQCPRLEHCSLDRCTSKSVKTGWIIELGA